MASVAHRVIRLAYDRRANEARLIMTKMRRMVMISISPWLVENEQGNHDYLANVSKISRIVTYGWLGAVAGSMPRLARPCK